MMRTSKLFRWLGFTVVLALLAGACGGRGDFTDLTNDDPVAELPEGIAVSVNPALLPDNFGVQLTALPAEAFAAGEAGDQWQAAAGALPANLRLLSAVFALAARGDRPEELFVSLSVPPETDAAVLDLYAWNGSAWNFLPSQVRGGQLVAVVTELPQLVAVFQAAALPPLAFFTLEPGQTLTEPVADAGNAVLLGGVLVQPDGTLGGQLPGLTLDGSFAVYPIVRNYTAAPSEAGGVPALLEDEAARANHLVTLVAFVVSGGYDGVVLDYAGLAPEHAPAYAQFVHDLAAQLHSQGKSLFVQVAPPQPSGDTFATGGYDWRALGEAVDGLFVPVADDPTAYGTGLAQSVLAWAVGEVPRSRVRLLTTALSVESVDGGFSLLDQASALAPLGSATLSESGEWHVGDPIRVSLSGEVQSLAYDASAFAASFAYTDSAGKSRTLWLTSANTLRQRLALAEKYQLGGVVVTGLLAPGVPADLLNGVTQYKASVDAAIQAQANLLWTVTGNGGLLAAATAQPNQPYEFVPPAAGEYQLAANLEAGGSVGLGSVAVQVAEASPTPEPTAVSEATATTAAGVSGGPTQPPRPTATPGGPTQPAPTATTASSGGGVFVPPPPIGAGTFELGGQVPGFIGHPNEMKSAGMTWVKFQVRGGGYDEINAAKANGFKVLLSVIGDKNRVMDPAYRAEYAGWVAGLAAAGADAIEVWNEPNIDHEWPQGQISAAAYTELLKVAYNAIKGANGGTMVISAGPSPTGAEGAFPGRVVNDDRFLREMAAAGAANYLDCIGTHFNQGTTSPNASSGAPLLQGYHYSYYFWPMVDTYWNAFAGTRPLCFTELGYLTGEGIGSLPGAFAWANETSLAEQAQWLAEAASLAGNSGKVRLMIVWNVDFTHFSGDPQAGYAIVRPDGSCPACAALGAVMP